MLEKAFSQTIAFCYKSLDSFKKLFH